MQFLPRICCIARLLSYVQRVAGWVSVTFVHCVETAKDMALVDME